MSNSIISNIAALSAQQNITNASNNAAESISRLSSGNRIAKASDDVAGLATGTALRTQVTTLKQALSNATQGTSLLQVADGAATQIINILQRQKAIATQASSGQLTDTNRSLLNQEFTNLTAQIDQIASSTNFNGVSLLAGTLGTNASLERTDALAATGTVAAPSLQNGVTAIASTVAVQAFTITAAGATALANVPATLGNLTVTDSAGTTLANAAYLNVDSNLYGKFSSFTLSNINYGAIGTGTATVTATINGSVYTGTVTSANAGATAILQNGNTYIKVGLGNVTLTDGASAATAQANINQAFSNTSIARVNTVNGVNFTGTALAGDIGNATQFVTARIAGTGSLNISNFTYVSNTGAANTSTITVQVNGQTFTALNVKDAIAANGTLQFADASGLQTITINTTGLIANSQLTTGNIRTDSTDRAALISALNTGFSKAGGNGLNFSVGSAATDTVNVSLGSTTTNSLYGGQSLDVSTAADATTASAVLDQAITKATSVEAGIGALESRFNFISSNLQTSIENQDSARSQLLDTDVSAESTAYASAQVQTQAGIAVLAQANQLPQALLKLIQ
jgi:flagellin